MTWPFVLQTPNQTGPIHPLSYRVPVDLGAYETTALLCANVRAFVSKNIRNSRCTQRRERARIHLYDTSLMLTARLPDSHCNCLHARHSY